MSRWPLYTLVDQDTREFKFNPIYSCKMSWDYSKKKESDSYINNWQLSFHMSDLREKYFFNLIDDNLNSIIQTYIKEGPWLKYVGHFNSLYIRVTRVIINHASNSKYYLRFFLNQDFDCSCRKYPIKSKCHILYEYRRFNNYWNLRRDSLDYFISFLKFNPNTFSFANSITL